VADVSQGMPNTRWNIDVARTRRMEGLHNRFSMSGRIISAVIKTNAKVAANGKNNILLLVVTMPLRGFSRQQVHKGHMTNIKLVLKPFLPIDFSQNAPAINDVLNFLNPDIWNTQRINRIPVSSYTLTSSPFLRLVRIHVNWYKNAD